MNDYFLRILIRQRHAKIVEEFRAIQLSRRDRHHKAGGTKGIIRMFLSFLDQWKQLPVLHKPEQEEKTGT